MVTQLTVIFAVLAYLFGGIFALAIYDMMTGRIRRNFSDSVTEGQVLLSENTYTQTLLSRKVTGIIIVIVMLVFWPLVFVGALQKGNNASDKKD